VREEDAFPEAMSGRPHLPRAAWRGWDEPYRTTYSDYVSMQAEKDASVYAVRDVVGKAEDYARLPAEWKSGLKLHAATLPLASSRPSSATCARRGSAVLRPGAPRRSSGRSTSSATRTFRSC